MERDRILNVFKKMVVPGLVVGFLLTGCAVPPDPNAPDMMLCKSSTLGKDVAGCLGRDTFRNNCSCHQTSI